MNIKNDRDHRAKSPVRFSKSSHFFFFGIENFRPKRDAPTSPKSRRFRSDDRRPPNAGEESKIFDATPAAVETLRKRANRKARSISKKSPPVTRSDARGTLRTRAKNSLSRNFFRNFGNEMYNFFVNLRILSSSILTIKYRPFREGRKISAIFFISKRTSRIKTNFAGGRVKFYGYYSLLRRLDSVTQPALNNYKKINA